MHVPCLPIEGGKMEGATPPSTAPPHLPRADPPAFPTFPAPAAPLLHGSASPPQSPEPCPRPHVSVPSASLPPPSRLPGTAQAPSTRRSVRASVEPASCCHDDPAYAAADADVQSTSATAQRMNTAPRHSIGARLSLLPLPAAATPPPPLATPRTFPLSQPPSSVSPLSPHPPLLADAELGALPAPPAPTASASCPIHFPLPFHQASPPRHVCRPPPQPHSPTKPQSTRSPPPTAASSPPRTSTAEPSCSASSTTTTALSCSSASCSTPDALPSSP